MRALLDEEASCFELRTQRVGLLEIESAGTTPANPSQKLWLVFSRLRLNNEFSVQETPSETP